MNRRILIVDDEEILLKTFSRLLERQGYEVYAVKTGEQALLMAGAVSFDLLICDLLMPGLGGFQTIRSLQNIYAREYLGRLSILVMTGFVNPLMEEKIESLGVDAVLWKPFGAEELLYCVNQILRVPEQVDMYKESAS